MYDLLHRFFTGCTFTKNSHKSTARLTDISCPKFSNWAEWIANIRLVLGDGKQQKVICLVLLSVCDCYIKSLWLWLWYRFVNLYWFVCDCDTWMLMIVIVCDCEEFVFDDCNCDDCNCWSMIVLVFDLLCVMQWCVCLCSVCFKKDSLCLRRLCILPLTDFNEPIVAPAFISLKYCINKHCASNRA